MKRALSTIIILLFAILFVAADEVSFVVSAPDAVEMGRNFRVSYTINRANVREPIIPSFDGFDVLSGPHRSTSMNMYITNGKREESHTVTFNYTLIPTKEGVFKLPVATIEVDGKQYKSNAISIKVLPADKTSRSSGASAVGGSRRFSSTNIAKDELFMTATLNKKNVFEQEAVLLTYKGLSNGKEFLKDAVFAVEKKFDGA